MRAAVMMRPFAVLFGLWTALAGAPTQAAEVGLVANSIIRTYTDHCDPLFFDRHMPPGARWDAALSENYARILRTRYLSNCEAFMTEEVLAAITVPRILSMFPRLSEDQSGQLTAEQLMLIGVGAYLDEVDATSCPNAPQGLELATSLRSATGSWFASTGYDDALDIARGYAQAKSYAAFWPGMPTAGNPCLEREGAYMFAAAYAVKAGLIPLQLSSGALPEADWQKNYDWDGDGVVGDDDTAANSSAQSPQGDYVEEPGDPVTGRGGDDTTDRTLDVSESDAATIAKLAGRWGTTAACDEPGDQIIIDGRDTPRIEGADLGCDLGSIRSFGNMTTFVGEGGDWSGQGAIQQGGPDVIDLFLFGDEQPRHLVRCGSNAEPQTPSRDTDDMSLDWDGAWVRSAAGGSEIAIPSFLQRGPVRALMNADEDYGTAYDGADGLSLSLRQYRIHTSSSAHRWLREGAASDVVAITYDLDKADFGVISGYLDSARSQAYYGICRQGANKLQCVDMFWHSRDQEAVGPIIDSVVRSFRP
ncbi:MULTISPECIES: hypothetical protein [unclassified Devosia]|uniref:hypothetical protein n=1 Tax=unclassified Devosia TaxID=196773 RepID=UPI0025C2F92A|nr:MULTISPECIES: hypothetical protein [unclassified Devosia]